MKIFLSGPIESSPDIEKTLYDVAYTIQGILQRGHSVYAPHLFWYSDKNYPVDKYQYLANDLSWIPVCDAVFRLPGESANADMEVAFAEQIGKKIFYDLDHIKWL